MTAANQTFFPRFLLHPDSVLQQMDQFRGERPQKEGSKAITRGMSRWEKKRRQKDTRGVCVLTTWWSRSQRGLVQVVKV